MAGYNWKDAALLNDMRDWFDNMYFQTSLKTGIGALDKEESRESIARACMLTCGYSLEETFEKEKDSERKVFGKAFKALLELASDSVDPRDEFEYRTCQEQAKQGISLFFKENPEIEAKYRREYDVNPADFNDKKMAQWTLEEMYYTAAKKVSEIGLPDFDYSSTDRFDSVVEQYTSIGALGNHVNYGLYHGMRDKINARYPDLDVYTNRLRTVSDIAKEIELVKGSQYQKIVDYIEGKPRSVAPFYMVEEKEIEKSTNKEIIRKTPVMSAAYAQKWIDFDVAPSTVTNTKDHVFDVLMRNIKENPAVHAEDPVKRIYIDGKNAYEKFYDKYKEKGTEKEINNWIKEDIVDALYGVKQRVELARIDLDAKGNPIACVQSIKTDPRALESDRKWYQTSLRKLSEKLWNNDKDQDHRHSEIIEHAEERQRVQMHANTYRSSFYLGIFAEIEAASNDNRNKELEVRNTAVMDRMSAKILETLSSENKPEDFRNDIRSIRSLMEVVGVTQEDMNTFAESLSEETKASVEQIRIWEKNVLNGAPNTVIPSIGDMNVGECVKHMLTMYQNAYYNKLGYENKLDPAFKTQNHMMTDANIDKKAVTYNDLLRAGAPESENTRVHNQEAPKREHTNERQAPNPAAPTPKGK